MRARGHSLREIRAAVRDGRLALGYIEELLPATGSGRSRREVAAERRPRGGARRADRDPARRAAGERRPAHRRGRRGAADHQADPRPRLPARRAAAARPRLRTVDATDRRGRGPPLPPLRTRADDRRRGAGARDGGGDGRPGREPAAGDDADHRVRAPPLPGALRRAGRRRAHGVRPRARFGRGQRLDGVLLRRSDRLHALHGRGGRRAGARSDRALHRDRRGDLARRTRRSSRRSATR